MSWDKQDSMQQESDAEISRNVLQQITKETFDVFDKGGTGHVNRSNVGNIVRTLGLNPSQAELAEIVDGVDHNCLHTDSLQIEEVDGRVSFEKFKDKVLPILLEHKMQRHDENTIKEAFRVIDLEKKGFIEPEKLAGLLSTYGEPFTQEEIEEMFLAAVDPHKGVIFYEEYASKLAND